MPTSLGHTSRSSCVFLSGFAEGRSHAWLCPGNKADPHHGKARPGTLGKASLVGTRTGTDPASVLPPCGPSRLPLDRCNSFSVTEGPKLWKQPTASVLWDKSVLWGQVKTCISADPLTCVILLYLKGM